LGLIKDILLHLFNPEAMLAGIFVSALLLTQRLSTVLMVAILVAVMSWVMLISKFEAEAQHGVYAYQDGWMRGDDLVKQPPIISPETLQTDQAHLAGVQIAGAFIWIMVIRFGLVAIVKRYKRRHP